MPNELTRGHLDNGSWFLSSCLVLMGITLNQSSVLLGINFSLADLVLFFIIVYLIFKRALTIPSKPLIFFLVVSIITLFSATILVPVRFPYNPDSLKLFNGYTKLLAVFMYFLVGYNLARMERGYEILKWFSVSSVLIGIFAFSPPLLGRRIDFLYYGSNRFRGLMNDPNLNCTVTAPNGHNPKT